MIFRCGKKEGFCSYDSDIKIFDSAGRPFYFHPNGKGKTYFNLPRGTYSTENALKKVSPVVYTLPKLARAEVKRGLPRKINFIYSVNPNKCTITIAGSVWTINLDLSFKAKPKPYIIYIFFHEIGHCFYGGEVTRSAAAKVNSEKKCDTFAAYHMLKRGYNPSQIYLANTLTLNDPDGTRKKLCFEIAKNIKRK